MFIDGPLPDHIQLRLMSFFWHFILANSSFGWWGAYLSSRGSLDADTESDTPSAPPPGIVVVPREWFGPAGPAVAAEELFPIDWVVV
jgi:hypothetical protein